MKRIFNLKCRGEVYPVNIVQETYFTWQLADCTAQKKFVFRLYLGEKLIYEKRKRGAEQRLALPSSIRLLPSTLYKYSIEAETDKYSETSDFGYFRSGLTEGFSPEAKWISDGSHFIGDTRNVGSPAVYLKKAFYVENAPKTAIVNICGLGFYELYVNGQRIGARVLEPGFTQYDKRVLYGTYDVRSALRCGENVIMVVLGDGWYNQTTVDTWGFYRAAWRDCPKLIFQLDYDDKRVVSDESWFATGGEIRSNALRAGEIRDHLYLFNDSESCVERNAALTNPPGGLLVPSYLPPIRECEKLKLCAVFEGKECIIYDFGRNISGYCETVFDAEGGEKVSLEYSDRITDGACDNESNRMYLFNPGLKYQTDEYTLSAGENRVKPSFVYHGFRYVALRGKVRVNEMNAYFVHTDLERVGEFSCSSETLNRLYDMSINAVLSNFHSFPTDCPHREKNGWTGDAQLALETCLYNFDMREAYRKWLDDFLDNQRLSGQISAIVPSCGWGYNWGSGPAWDVALFRLTYALWYYYDDEETARKMYPCLKRYYTYLSSYEQNGLVCVGLGDWNYPKRRKFSVCPTELTDSGYYKQMSHILGLFAKKFKDPNAEKYFFAEKRINEAIKKKYSNESSLTGLAALTYFDVIDKSAEIAEYLEKNSYIFDAGILGIKFVLSALGKSKQCDTAFRALERREYPSFGYWAENGQTSLCEDFEMTNSLNHCMYSYIAEYMSRYVCGLDFGKGMRTVELNPALPSGLTFAKTRFKSLYGDYLVELRRGNGGVHVSFAVPCNCAVTYKSRTYRAGEWDFFEEL